MSTQSDPGSDTLPSPERLIVSSGNGKAAFQSRTNPRAYVKSTVVVTLEDWR